MPFLYADCAECTALLLDFFILLIDGRFITLGVVENLCSQCK